MGFYQKVNTIKNAFLSCKTVEEKYEKIIDLGRQISPYPAQYKTEGYLVSGCQSRVYLYSYFENGNTYFTVDSDALISSGLAALLLAAYNGETPEMILKEPPTFLEELGIPSALSPNRANGLYSMHLRMKQEALKYLITS